MQTGAKTFDFHNENEDRFLLKYYLQSENQTAPHRIALFAF